MLGGVGNSTFGNVQVVTGDDNSTFRNRGKLLGQEDDSSDVKASGSFCQGHWDAGRLVPTRKT